jgi:hypothetical protein
MRNDKIKGELRLPFVLSAIRAFTTAPVGASRLAPTREKLSDLLFA